MKRRYLTVATAVVAALTVISQASAELISNGTFEAVTGSTFDGWTYGTSSTPNAALDQTGSVIAGSHSAELVKGEAYGLYQAFGAFADNTTYTMSFDFASFAATSSGRTLDMLVPIIYDSTKKMYKGIHLAVFESEGSQVLKTASTSWNTISDFTGDINTTSGSVWGSITPVENEMTITLYWGTSESDSTYDITLNGETKQGLSYFGGTGAVYPPHSIIFQAGSSQSNYLVDNVSVSAVPEPSTVALFFTGIFGLLAYAWRKRK